MTNGLASAYTQWGIKHKTYKGQLRPFKEWMKGRSFSQFAVIKPWIDEFGDKFLLRNFDALDDVVSDFLSLFDIPLNNIQVVRDNESPNSAELAAWAVFNAMSYGEVVSGQFMQIAGPSNILRRRLTVPRLSELMPNTEQLTDIVRQHQNDIQSLNAILRLQAQSEISIDSIQAKDKDPSDWELNVTLMRMIFSLQQQVFDLQTRLRNMESLKAKGVE